MKFAKSAVVVSACVVALTACGSGGTVADSGASSQNSETPVLQKASTSEQDAEKTDAELEAAQAEAGISQKTVKKPEYESLDQLVGLSLEEADKQAEKDGYEARIVKQDGEELGVDSDLRQDRVNFTLVDGLVTEAEIY